jgi:hypothetical protein
MSGPLPNRFMIERRYGPSNCDWLHGFTKNQTMFPFGLYARGMP